MKLAAQAPSPIVSANNGRGPISMTLEYQGPKTVKTDMGIMPKDIRPASADIDLFSYRSERESDNHCYYHQPVLDAQGKPVLETKTIQLEETTASTQAGMAMGATTGALIGLALGGVAALCTHTGWLPAVGAAITGIAVGAQRGYSSANDDRIRVEWKENSIDSAKLTGISSHQSPVTKGVTFSPDFETTSHGTYFAPEVVHYKASTGRVFSPYTNYPGPL